jgi:hypothetical protein
MSDHVDGPRSIGDPAADLTDLFAFVSPENSGNTVIAANVFPAAGESAIAAVVHQNDRVNQIARHVAIGEAQGARRIVSGHDDHHLGLAGSRQGVPWHVCRRILLHW